MSTSNLGTLTSTPKSKNDSTLTISDPTDVYKFTITETSSINLSLNEISSGDNADLFLYKDSNGNGQLDSTDTLLSSSKKSSRQDEAINFKADAGTYFAQVKRYAPGSSGTVTYDLDLSATSIYPSAEHVPNLLPVEVNIGNLSWGTVKTFNGSVGDTDTSDIYKVSLSSYKEITITLTGLSADADIRVIRDLDNDRIFDPGSGDDTLGQAMDGTYGYSTNAGTLDETLSGGFYGDFYIQVYQYSGNTNYQLQLVTPSIG